MLEDFQPLAYIRRIRLHVAGRQFHIGADESRPHFGDRLAVRSLNRLLREGAKAGHAGRLCEETEKRVEEERSRFT